MIPMVDLRLDERDGGIIATLTGRLTLARLGDLPARLTGLSSLAQIDLSAVERMDTVGAWLVVRTAHEHGAAIVGASTAAARLIEAVEAAGTAETASPRAPFGFNRLLGDVGAGVINAANELAGIVGFLGATVVAFARMLWGRRTIRWAAIVTRFQTVGVNALAIIGLMTFLIGIVIAQQGAVQLEQFGLDVFTINLVGRSAIRELGLLMTAIMVAGRSGSAFAAQIGTMRLTEEIDALRTIGVSPMEAIILPRVLSTVILMPLLGFYASITAIIGGGLFCWYGLDIPPTTYVQRLREIIPMTDFYSMLIKAPVFGLVIGVTGCYHGMQVRQNAEEVGQRTTAAVVAGIFLVIVLDAFFAVFFTGLGWN